MEKLLLILTSSSEQLSSKADTSSVLKELQKSAKDTEQSSEVRVRFPQRKHPSM